MSLIRCENGHMFSSRRYGTVCPYCNLETATKEKEGLDPDVDIEDYLMEEAEPVCGWLVCIQGKRLGRDYKIKSGKNFIGRGDEMDIQIIGDNKICHRNHAIIVFDPKKRNFMMLPGDASGLVYLNDEAVYVPSPLASYDIIELGDSKFLFVPFCGEHFEWEG